MELSRIQGPVLGADIGRSSLPTPVPLEAALALMQGLAGRPQHWVGPWDGSLRPLYGPLLDNNGGKWP